MKYLILLLSLCCGVAKAQTNEHTTTTKYNADHPKQPAQEVKQPTLVYVCNSNGVYWYHFSEKCRVYKQCKHTESRIDLEEAKRQKFKPCPVCKPQ